MWFADIYCDIGWVAGQNGHLGARRMRLSGPRLGRRGLGHANTEMVIRHYHKFIPNLTRQDGSALATQIQQTGLQ